MKKFFGIIKKLFCNFLLIVQFFTRIPVNINLSCEMEDFRRGAVFLPIVGLIIGIIQWAVYKLCIKVIPLNATIALVILTGVIITGGFHIDGLGDTCDGFFAFKGDEKIIEIMKDSRIGTYSCIAIVMDLLFRYSLLTFVVNGFSIAIIVVPAISRICTIFISCIGKTAKSTGTGNFLINNVGKKEFIISLVIIVFILTLIMNPRYVAILIISSMIFTVLFNAFCKSKIGGLTGDSLGAINELNEILALIIIAMIVKNFIG